MSTCTSLLPSYFDTGVYLKLYPPGEQNMEEGRVKDALGKEVGLKWCRAYRLNGRICLYQRKNLKI